MLERGTDVLNQFIAPGSDEWRQTISASKVPAILGLSPWQSPYELYKVMRGEIEPKPGNSETSRGHYLEPAILEWFFDRHPELTRGPTRTVRHPEHPEWTCTPDAEADGDPVEAKSVAYPDGFGDEGTAEVVPYYLAQGAWQMVCTGRRIVYMPIITGGLEFREYVIRWEDVEQDVPIILDYVHDFQRRLREGDAPDFDGSDSTYQTVRRLHPGIEDHTVTIPEAMASAFATALAAEKAAVAEARRHKAIIADYMGEARKATTEDGQAVATRSSRGGTPYLVAARTIHQLAS